MDSCSGCQDCSRRFSTKTFEELFQVFFCSRLEKTISPRTRFPISKAKCVKSKLHNEPSVQAISKKAVKSTKNTMPVRRVPLMETGPEFKIEYLS